MRGLKHDESDLSIEHPNDEKQRRLALHMRAFHYDFESYQKSLTALQRDHKKAHRE